jgi:MFS family permease
LPATLVKFSEGESAKPEIEPGLPPDAAGVVIAGAFLLLISFGIAYALPVFFPVLARTLTVPAWHLTALFSVTGAVYFSLGILTGPAADRIGARTLATAGQIAMAGGLILTSAAQNEFELALGCLSSIGIGVGLTYVPVVGAVQALCRKNPALAGGITASGIGAGTLALPPLANFLIDQLGWRHTLQILGALAGGGALVAMRLARMEPLAQTKRALTFNNHGPMFIETLTSERFVMLYSAQFLISLVAFVPFAHLVLFAKAQGWPAATGVYLISLIGFGGLCGRILVSLIAESLGSCRTGSLCAILMAFSLMALTLFAHRYELYADATVYGFGYGGLVGLTGPMVAEVIGVQGICRSVGYVVSSRAIGVLTGPWAVGVIAFLLGGYQIPFLICGGIALTAAILLHVLHHRAAAAPGAGLVGSS